MIQVIYVGSLWEGGTCLERAKAVRNVGWDLHGFDITRYQRCGGRIRRALQHRALAGPDVRRLNRDLIQYVKRHGSPDFIWIDKGRWILAETLRELSQITNALLVHYTPDPAFSVHTSRHFRGGLRYYDLCVTTKRYELEDYRRAGARNVLFNLQGVDDRFARSASCELVGSPDRHGVVFIGHREKHYESILLELTRPDADLSIWGAGWEQLQDCRSPLATHVRGSGAWGKDYPLALSSGRIGLGLLSKKCPDAFTTRSIEIPASGTMLLAERTNEHMELFKEAKEAEFFATTGELLEKAEFYLSNDAARIRIAARGREKALSEYTWDRVLSPTFSTLKSMLGSA